MVEATRHSTPMSGWTGMHEAQRKQETTSKREEPELFSLFEEELGESRLDRACSCVRAETGAATTGSPHSDCPTNVRATDRRRRRGSSKPRGGLDVLAPFQAVSVPR